MATVSDLDQLLDQHLVLDLQCLDRIYLNAYVPTLQVAGQVVTFLTHQLGYPIPSPALFANLGNDFRKAVKTFARRHGILLFQFKKRQRKIDAMRPYLNKAAEHPVLSPSGLPRSSSPSWSAMTAPPSPAPSTSASRRPIVG